MKRFLLPALAALALTACKAPDAPLPTVAAVDLDRYYGTWYEIARLPNRFQSMCASDIRATYRPDGENVSVLNQCRTADGKLAGCWSASQAANTPGCSHATPNSTPRRSAHCSIAPPRSASTATPSSARRSAQAMGPGPAMQQCPKQSNNEYSHRHN